MELAYTNIHVIVKIFEDMEGRGERREEEREEKRRGRKEGRKEGRN